MLAASKFIGLAIMRHSVGLESPKNQLQYVSRWFPYVVTGTLPVAVLFSTVFGLQVFDLGSKQAKFQRHFEKAKKGN